MNFKMFLKFSKIQYVIVKMYIQQLFLRRQIFRFCTAAQPTLYVAYAAFHPQWQ